MPTKANPKGKSTAGTLQQLSAQQQETIMGWLEQQPPLSYPDAAAKATADFGIYVKPWEVWHFADRHLLARRLARSLASASSLDSLSAEQRAKLRQALKDKTRLQLDGLLDESLREKTPGHLARALSGLIGAIDSCDRTELALKAHELNVRTADLREQDIALRVREQDRKDESLKLERERYEAEQLKNSKTREALDRLEGKGGVTPEARAELVNTLSGVSN